MLDELAHHFFQAAPAGEARAPSSTAAAPPSARNACSPTSRARGSYERALQVFELHGPRRPGAARRARAGGRRGARAGGRARACPRGIRSAAEIGRELGRADFLARAALGYRGPGEMGSPIEDAALALLEEALRAVADGTALRARLLSRLAGSPPYSDSLATRDAMSREALDLARRAGEARRCATRWRRACRRASDPTTSTTVSPSARELLQLAERSTIRTWRCWRTMPSSARI